MLSLVKIAVKFDQPTEFTEGSVKLDMSVNRIGTANANGTRVSNRKSRSCGEMNSQSWKTRLANRRLNLARPPEPVFPTDVSTELTAIFYSKMTKSAGTG